MSTRAVIVKKKSVVDHPRRPKRIVELDLPAGAKFRMRVLGGDENGNSAREGVISAVQLAKHQFEPIVWIVPDLLPTGLFLFSGKPKSGKSFLALQLAMSVAEGGYFFGHKLSRARVLYLALEDTPRRLQDRMRKMNEGNLGPKRLDLATKWSCEKDGGAQRLLEYLDAHEDCRLVVIDTLARWRAAPNPKEAIYYADYEALKALKKIADTLEIAILVITHNSKRRISDAGDPADLISGSTGLTGGTDGAWVLQRPHVKDEGTLDIIGRDLPHTLSLAVRFQRDACRWEMLGNASDFAVSEARKRIAKVLAMAKEPLSRREIAERLDQNPDAVRKVLTRMSDAGEVLESEMEGRKLYRLPRNPEAGNGQFT